MVKYFLKIYLIFLSFIISGQKNDSLQLKEIYSYNLTKGNCYENLRSLCKDIGNRLSGSISAQKAVEWAGIIMKKTNLDTVYFQKIMVPHWVRGDVESVFWKNQNGDIEKINCTALGGSVGTNGTLEGQVIEIKNWSELEKYGKKNIKGKIVFFNRAMNPTYILSLIHI